MQTKRDSNELFSEYFQFQNIPITDLDNNIVHINKLVTSSKLFYRFSKFACNGSVENDFQILEELGDSIGNENIIVLSRYSNLKDINIYCNNLNPPFECYNYQPDIDIPIEKEAINNSPYFFILNPNLEVRFAYTSIPSHTFKSAYFQRIIQFYLH